MSIKYRVPRGRGGARPPARTLGERQPRQPFPPDVVASVVERILAGERRVDVAAEIGAHAVTVYGWDKSTLRLGYK